MYIKPIFINVNLTTRYKVRKIVQRKINEKFVVNFILTRFSERILTSNLVTIERVENTK